MAYDRFDTRDTPRSEHSRWSEDRNREHGWRSDERSNRDDRGFFERAGDEISSWFGDEDAERRRREDRMREEREGGSREHDRERGWDQDRGWGRDRDRDRDRERDWNDNRGTFARGGSSERDYNPNWRRELRRRQSN